MTSSQKIRRIASHYLLTPQGFVKNPLVEFCGDKVVGVGQCDTPDAEQGVEFYSGVLMAGVVNTHSHLELSYLRGAVPKGCGGGFAAAIAAAREGYTAAVCAEAMYREDAQMWTQGVQVVGDVANSAESLALKRTSPIHYHTFLEVFGLRSDNFAAMQTVADAAADQRVSLTPHSTYSVQSALFERVSRIDTTSPLSVHFEETAAEKELFAGRGSLAQWYSKMGFECDFLRCGLPAERLVEQIPPSRSVILVHDCCVTAIDVEIILSHFTAPVYWCLCPRSNRYISGVEPSSYRLLRSYGANICVGTDSLASNESLSVVDELKCFSDVPLAELLGWATIGGARALGMSDRFGSVEVGKRCGLVLLTGVDFSTMTLRADASTRRLI